MAEYVKHMNDIMWSYIYRFNYTDKIIVPIIICGMICGVLMVFLKKKQIILFFMVLAAGSVNYAVIRSPVISTKLFTALHTTGSVIAGSSRYADEFYKITGYAVKTEKDVVYIIYHQPDKRIKKKLINSSAGQLYLGYFNCEKRITGCLGISLIHEISLWLVIFSCILFLKKNILSNFPILIVTTLYGCLITDDVTVGAVLFFAMAYCVRHIILLLKRREKHEKESKNYPGNSNSNDSISDTVIHHRCCRRKRK